LTAAVIIMSSERPVIFLDARIDRAG